MYFNVNFNVFFKLIKEYLMMSELNKHRVYFKFYKFFSNLMLSDFSHILTHT